MGQGSSIALSCGVGCRCTSDPALLWLWHRPAATAPIRPLAWEPPYAEGAALEMAKKKKKSLETTFLLMEFHLSLLLVSLILYRRFEYHQIFIKHMFSKVVIISTTTSVILIEYHIPAHCDRNSLLPLW